MSAFENQKARDLELLDSIARGTHPAVTYPDAESGFTKKFPCTAQKEALSDQIGEIALRYADGKDGEVCDMVKRALAGWADIVDTQKSDREAREQKRIAKGYAGRDTALLEDSFPLLQKAVVANPNVKVRGLHAVMQEYGVYDNDVARTVFGLEMKELKMRTNDPGIESLCIEQRRRLPAQSVLLNNSSFMSYSKEEQFALKNPEGKVLARWQWGEAKVLEIKGAEYLALRQTNGLCGIYDTEGRCVIAPVFRHYFVFDDVLEAVNYAMDIWCYYSFEHKAPIPSNPDGCTLSEAIQKLMTPNVVSSDWQEHVRSGMIFVEKKPDEINFYEIMGVNDDCVEFIKADNEYTYQNGICTLATHGADIDGVRWTHRAIPQMVDGQVQLWGDDETPACVPWDGKPIVVDSDKARARILVLS